MVSSLSDTLDSGLMALTVIEDGRDLPTQEELEELDEFVVSWSGWAFRFGMGASQSLNDYRYGYLVPGKVLNPSTIERLDERVKAETSLDNPTILMKSVQFPESGFEGMEKLGRFPSEVLSSLDGLKDEVERKKD